MIRYILIVLILFLTQTNADNIFWQDSLQDSKELAKKFNKPLFIFMESRRCYYCPIMKEKTFTDKDIIKLINENYIPVILDNSTGSESDVANTGHAPERLTTSITPAIYIMGPNEEKLARKGKKHMLIYGFWEADDLKIWLEKGKRIFQKLYGEKYAK
ncbi:MAG: hypothetical protein B1H07_03725 [Campylobacteraceae bacterium 4484_166]|nr:MAG: hypothetical protein B1H07_03725 [Campylobacteraceae bacterium 4484_166]